MLSNFCFILIRRDYFDRCFVNLTGGFDFAKFGHFTGLESRLFITQGQLIVVLGQKQLLLHTRCCCNCRCQHSRRQTGFGIPPLLNELLGLTQNCSSGTTVLCFVSAPPPTLTPTSPVTRAPHLPVIWHLRSPGWFSRFSTLRPDFRFSKLGMTFSKL